MCDLRILLYCIFNEANKLWSTIHLNIGIGNNVSELQIIKINGFNNVCCRSPVGRRQGSRLEHIAAANVHIAAAKVHIAAAKVHIAAGTLHIAAAKSTHPPTTNTKTLRKLM